MEDLSLTTHKGTPKETKEIQEKTQAELVANAGKEERNALPYITASSCTPIGAVVPTKLAYETVEALNVFIQNGIDTANFVKEKLGYDSRLSVCSAFASEQVDAIALAIKQIEKNKGFIVGDMAGIGKGRVVAGICRYAKQQNKIPVFITIGDTLFSDQYRDIADIGGYSGSVVPLNDNKKLPTAFIFNEKASIVKTEKGKEIVLQKAYKLAQTVALCNKKVMPTNTDVVFLTYTQIDADMENPKNAYKIAKYEFLKAIAPNSIFVLDESHKGSGDGNSAKNLFDLLSLASGVTFASATYAKVPKSMMLYIPKTDIVDSRIRPETIIDAVAENGEAIQEYIASLLVKSGQMIRRERSFDDCIIDYKYMNLGDKAKYYERYDKLMKLYDEIEAFANSPLYNNAYEDTIKRYAAENEILIVAEKKKPTKTKDKAKWQTENANKYNVDYTTRNSMNNRFQWIENLLFSIKADYVAEETIRLLRTREKVQYLEGTNKVLKESNFKPIIAVRNTAEASLSSLGYQTGEILTKEQNDYAKTLVNILTSLNSGKLTFTPVNKAKQKIEIKDAKIELNDYADGGYRFKQILADLKVAYIGLPLSPIDHMVSKIENARRESWDYKYTSKDYYIVEELTKRSLSIKPYLDEKSIAEITQLESKLTDARTRGESDSVKRLIDEIENKRKEGYDKGLFQVVNRKSDSTTKKVARFNRGESDVVLLNTSGSTGISLHSKSDFIDKRPRAMLIHQVELDVATEVQKRGRIHRTGQVNFPRYAYIVSVIPSEVRKLLMLRRKLRSLDANTTGNVKQSAKSSEILDSKGNEIEDMTNKYGYTILMNYLDLPGKQAYKDVFSEEWYTAKGSPETKFEAYLRKLEQLPCEMQEEFYNDMNAAYSLLKADLIEKDEWDLETNIEDLKSSTINKKVIYIGNNENEFTKSVYAEDKFVNSKGKPYTKEEVSLAIEKLSGSKYHTEKHNQLKEEFRIHMENKLMEIRNSYGDADLSNAVTEEEIEKAIENHNIKVEAGVRREEDKLLKIEDIFIRFSPSMAVQLPIDTSDLDNGAYEKDSTKRKQLVYVVGKFIGYKFSSKSDNKYSPMNIEMQFAAPSKLRPHLKISLTLQYAQILEWIKTGFVSAIEIERMDEWVVPKSGERDKMRVLTGEIFKAFEITNELFKSNPNFINRKKLIKYTTNAGQVETGVKLYQKKWFPLNEGKSPAFAQINNPEFKKDLFDWQKSWKPIWLPGFKEYLINDQGSISFNISTGIYPNQRGYDRTKPDKLYKSELATQEFYDKIKEVTGVECRIQDVRGIDMYAGGTQKYFWRIQFARFFLTQDQTSDLLDYLYSEFQNMMQIEGSDFIVENVTDTFEEAQAEEQSEKGIYEYYPLSKFDTDATPPNYIKDSYKETRDNKNGIISLSYPLSPIQSNIFKIVPANISELQAMKNIFRAIKDDEKRIKFIEKVKELGDDYNEIGEYTQSTIGVHPKYAIGNVDYYLSGEIISANIDLASTETKKVESAKQSGKEEEKIPLNWETIQDFIIKLKSI